MKGFVDDIEGRTEQNTDFRRVLYTGKHMQLVLMALRPAHVTKADAEAAKEPFDGKTTE